jgi:MFS transporter, ACS family, hexuronate transporter
VAGFKHNRASNREEACLDRKPIPNLRWWIVALLFASTVINYIDRQTLSVLAPFLKQEYKWSNTDFAWILFSFRLAYALGQGVSGRLLDWLGTRRGLTISVTFYSIVACLTSLARGIVSFKIFRFLLGAGESANWPGAAKAVSEWFPEKQRGLAVAIYDSGSSIGGVVAPFLVLFLYGHFGSWRPAFVITGCLGFLWLIIWVKLYRPPEKHPRISAEELELIQRDRGTPGAAEEGPAVRWPRLLHYRQTWGIVLGRAILDPYWFLIAEWFPLYLMSRGFQIEQSVLGFWAPFLGSDLGNLFGGALSSWWISRGWPVGKARRAVILIFGPCMLVLVGTLYTSDYVLLVLIFAFATFAYAACATMFLTMPADAFDTRAVASVSGLSGAAAGLITLITTLSTGVVSDRSSFAPVILVAALAPCLATVILVSMVRSGKKPDPAGLLKRF